MRIELVNRGTITGFYRDLPMPTNFADRENHKVTILAQGDRCSCLAHRGQDGGWESEVRAVIAGQMMKRCIL
jgi:hypothetical protein